jgi:Ser/Thr protein kinase RdoA (MazF antagonist)
MSSLFPVVDSIAAPHALAERVRAEYGLEGDIDMRLYQTGFNDTYVARMGDGTTYYVRVYRRGWRTREDALCELAALDHLRHKGIPAAYPLARTTSGFLFEIEAPEGLRGVAAFVEAKGRLLKYEEDSASLCTAYGKAVAAMHNAWEDFASPHPRFRLDLEHLIDGPVECVEPLLAHRPDDLNYLKRFAAAVRRRIVEIPDPEIAYCHGDLQGFHAHMDDEGILTFYDFDCGGFGYRAYDLAVFRWSARFDDQELPRWEPFLEAYREHRTLADQDLEAVPLFVCARHVWHMGVHAQNAPHWGYASLHDAYYDRRIGWLRMLAEDYGIEV